MKTALRYGLLITAVLVVWVIVVRFVMDVGPDSTANILGPILFNLTAIVAIYKGVKSRKQELAGELTFKEALKTGMSISLTYAITACLFFIIVQLVAGPKLLLSEAGPEPGPIWRVALFAYGGLFFGSLFFGLIYSTAVGFILARRLRSESSEII